MESDNNMNSRVASFSCYLDTAKENLVHKVLSQETPMQLNSAKLSSPSTIPPFNISFSHSKERQDGLATLSLSHPNNAGENFAIEAPGPIKDPTSAFSFSHGIPKYGEIGVFGADKYFNMKLEYQTGIKRNHKNEGPLTLPLAGSYIKPRTSSSCSIESSLNSQTVLLSDLQGLRSLTSQRKAFGWRIFGRFRCHGPCFDKKSVDINEIAPCYGSNPTRTGSGRIDQLALLPNLNPKTDNSAVKKQLEVANIEESRHSIEVFGSSTKGDVATKMERKLSMLTWDAIPKGQNLPTSTVGSGTICDDIASDASSDLFEIEQISGSLYPVPTDDMSSCLSPQSHYAPSEASIQWSVVTASAADYSAFADYNDESSVSIAGEVFSKNNRSSKCTKNGGRGRLLGCKNQKSVAVAENVCHKANEKVEHKGLDLSASFGKSPGNEGRMQSIVTPKLQRSFVNGGGF